MTRKGNKGNREGKPEQLSKKARKAKRDKNSHRQEAHGPRMVAKKKLHMVDGVS